MRRRLIATALPVVAIPAGVTVLYVTGYLWPIVTTIIRPLQPRGRYAEPERVG